MNGSKYGSVTVFPNIIEFTCDEGFDLLRSSRRKCQSNGNWSGHQPTCKAVDCGRLGAPQNGSLQGSLTNFPNVITFNCDKGFILLGSSSRTCQANRTWSGILTSCKAKDCGPLAVPLNGSTSGRKTVFPNIINFFCDEGFDLIGSSLRTCLSDGTWSGNQTSCKAVDCGPLTVPLNGSRQGSLTFFPNVMTFSCDEGFILHGSSSRVCQANRMWSGSETDCKAIDCGPLFVPMNGSVSGEKTFFPSSIQFSCDEGFDLIGSSKRVCTSSGRWDGNLTSCKAVDCGPLAIPLNGSSLGSVTVFPNIITFQCDRGFILKGSSSRQCQSNLRWSGTTAACEAVDCGPVRAPMNGSKHGSVTVFPNLVKFTCDPGFILKGKSYITCEAAGKWSHAVPHCDAIDCGPLATPINGSLHGKLTVFPNLIKFKCKNGFDLIGSDVRRCQSNESWSGKTTQCKAVDCGPLNTPPHANLKIDGTTFTEKAYYSCNDGYLLQGKSVRVCQADRTWSETQPRCNAVNCGVLPALSNGNTKGRLTVYPNKVTFTCNEGFALIGSVERQCLANGRWSGSQPYCRAMRCTKPSTPPNSYMTTQVKKYYGNNDVVYYSCKPGFFLRGGRPLLACMHGKWNKPSFVCAAPMCNPPSVPVNAYITFPRGKGGPYVENDEIYFSCVKGYYLTGNPSIQCKNDWTDFKFICHPVECGPLPKPSHGFIVRTTGTTFKKVYEFGCRFGSGFKMKGSQKRTCQANKQWSGQQLFCYLLSCPNPGSPKNGLKMNSNYTYNNVVRFRCNKGYSDRGFKAIRCQLNEKWTAKKLTCLECTSAIGMRNYKITNAMLSASSERDSGHSAKQARLFGQQAWCSARSEYEKYLEVNFGSAKEVTAISTQGHPTEYKWMNKYELRYALGNRWFHYRINGKIKVFPGNKDRNSVMKHVLEPSIIAHKLRIYQHQDSQTFTGSSVCLRAEFFGCEFYTECLTLGTRVFALWHKWSKEVVYVMSYVISIDEETLTVVPHEKHSNLDYGSALIVLKGSHNPPQILKDVTPKETDLRIGSSVLTLNYKEGMPVYSTGTIRNILGASRSWYHIRIDGSDYSWKRRRDLRLKIIPTPCDITPSNKLEIKLH